MNFENIAKSNKPEEQMRYDSMYMKYLEWVNLYRQMVEMDVTKEGGLGSLKFFLLFIYYFWPYHEACGILVPCPTPTWQ